MIGKLENEIAMLERHLTILQLVLENEPIGIVSLSNKTGTPHHKIRYSLRILEEKNLIEPSERGAVPKEPVQDFLKTHRGLLDGVIEQLNTMTPSITNPQQNE